MSPSYFTVYFPIIASSLLAVSAGQFLVAFKIAFLIALVNLFGICIYPIYFEVFLGNCLVAAFGDTFPANSNLSMSFSRSWASFSLTRCISNASRSTSNVRFSFCFHSSRTSAVLKRVSYPADRKSLIEPKNLSHILIPAQSINCLLRTSVRTIVGFL